MHHCIQLLRGGGMACLATGIIAESSRQLQVCYLGKSVNTSLWFAIRQSYHNDCVVYEPACLGMSPQKAPALITHPSSECTHMPLAPSASCAHLPWMCVRSHCIPSRTGPTSCCPCCLHQLCRKTCQVTQPFPQHPLKHLYTCAFILSCRTCKNCPSLAHAEAVVLGTSLP
jgi:hypothetical protein